MPIDSGELVFPEPRRSDKELKNYINKIEKNIYFDSKYNLEEELLWPDRPKYVRTIPRAHTPPLERIAEPQVVGSVQVIPSDTDRDWDELAQTLRTPQEEAMSQYIGQLIE